MKTVLSLPVLQLILISHDTLVEEKTPLSLGEFSLSEWIVSTDKLRLKLLWLHGDFPRGVDNPANRVSG
jgi:hypothetical protein